MFEISLREITERLQSLHQTLAGLRRKKILRDILKVLGIGFFIYRNVDQRIAAVELEIASFHKEVGEAIVVFLEYAQKEKEKLNNSDTYIPKNEEEQLLVTLKAFEKDVDYLRRAGILDETRVLAVISEIEIFRHFVMECNLQIERKKLRQQLIRLKNEILQAEHDFNSLYDCELYFSKRDLYSWKNSWSYLIQPIEESVRKGATDVDFLKAITRVVGAYHEGDKWIETRNKKFAEEEMARYKDFFDNVESQPLTYEQRKAIVFDEANNLVVAGAGTGKTSTIIGKVGYLIKKGLAKPEEILLVAFNKDVVVEMKRRLSSKFGIAPSIQTYHSLGLNIITESTGEKPSVSELAEDKAKLPHKIREFVESHMQDEKFAKLINGYFLFYSIPYKSFFEFNSYGEYIDYIKKHDVRSLKGDKVKSLEECYIANYLYANGINYLYENSYEVKTASKLRRQYKPDFFLPEYGIYIEHFGIDRRGKTAPYIIQSEYNEQITWKRNLHKTNHTILIETYSYERQEGQLLNNLEKKLREKGVVISQIPKERLFEKLDSLGKIDSFSTLLANFLNLYKSCGRNIEEIKKEVDQKDTRTMVFLDVFSKICDDYNSYLEKNEEIDFNDMISMATSLVRNGEHTSRFKYVLVDEFQDISQSRYRLLKRLLDHNEAKLFCVGDDWQSVYRFTGSDLSIMVDFEENFGFSETCFLQETFRFSDKLCDFSTKFILQNPIQIKKKITSRKKEETPVVTTIQNDTKQALKEIISEIAKKSHAKQTIFIIGRYNYLEPENLNELRKAFAKLTIEFTTAHSSKGLEADYVILVGLTSGEYGFPCEIVDDPILNLVLTEQDSFPNAEERRLFYVAITRAKKHVYLVVDENKYVSSFVSEIQHGGYEINLQGEKVKTSSCPICKTGEIVPKKGKYGDFYSCNNYPYCEYIAKDCPRCKKGFLERKRMDYRCSEQDCAFHAEVCPSCDDGYLIRRQGRKGGYFYGCSNYPNCTHIKREFHRERHYRRYAY